MKAFHTLLFQNDAEAVFRQISFCRSENDEVSCRESGFLDSDVRLQQGEILCTELQQAALRGIGLISSDEKVCEAFLE